MQKSDPRFSRFLHGSREEVFERLNKSLIELARYIPATKQNPFWKSAVMSQICRKWEEWTFMNGWSWDFDFPLVQECFESVVQQLGIVGQVALLDPRLQIEAVPVNDDMPLEEFGAPSGAFPVQKQKWITKIVDVRPATEVLLLLFRPDIERLSKDEVMDDLRHELGHAFLYLREPEATDDCAAADEEWKRCTTLEDLIVPGEPGDLREHQ
jgi:hypothetical protein